MAGMEVERPKDAGEFLERAGEFLLAREAVHNLPLGLCSRLRTHPLLSGEEPDFAVAVEGDDVVAATMRTPPHNLILTAVDDFAALEPLADDAAAAFGKLPGVGGPREPVARLAEIWETRTGAKAEISMRLRIYEANKTRPPEGVPGRMRPYEDRDGALVIAWMDAFVDEAMAEPPPETSQEWLERPPGGGRGGGGGAPRGRAGRGLCGGGGGGGAGLDGRPRGQHPERGADRAD